MSDPPGAVNDAIVLSNPGENDVTIIFKPQPGAKRWQHLERQQQPAGGDRIAIEDNYTVILGSHRNSKLKFEKNGETVKEVPFYATTQKIIEVRTCMLTIIEDRLSMQVQNVPGSNVSAKTFKSCWVNYSTGEGSSPVTIVTKSGSEIVHNAHGDA
jgi:uncharacterized protein YkuJ